MRGVSRSLFFLLLLLGTSLDAFANQPPIYVRDVCDPVADGDSIVEARIVSFDQPRYTCEPHQGSTVAWMDSIDRQGRLKPTRTTGCIVANLSMVGLDENTLNDDNRPVEDPAPRHITVRVDGAPVTVNYDRMWAVCGLTAGHHAVEMDTDRGPLTCDGVVRAGETLAMQARAYRAILQIEATRLLAGAPLQNQTVSVEYDELNFSPLEHSPRYKFPASAVLRVWKSADGVVHAERCPQRPVMPVRTEPKATPRGGCAHCAADSDAPCATILFAFIVLSLLLVRRRFRARARALFVECAVRVASMVRRTSG
jgi:hypothetical protein